MKKTPKQLRWLLLVALAMLTVLVSGCEEDPNIRARRNAEAKASQYAQERDQARREAAAAKRDAAVVRKKLAEGTSIWKILGWILGWRLYLWLSPRRIPRYR